MIGVRVEFRRFVDDHQPGWVECRLTDTHGREWAFVEKVRVVTAAHLDAASSYPTRGIIACRILDRRGGAEDGEVITICTEEPWHVEATTGETRFEVRPEKLEEFDSNGGPKQRAVVRCHIWSVAVAGRRRTRPRRPSGGRPVW